MFVSFFPRPKAFLISGLLWTIFAMAAWYLGARELPEALGLVPAGGGEEIVGASLFWAPGAIWFDAYYWAAVLIFYAAWQAVARHPWANWSILGSALILFTVYLQVQVSLAFNSWYGPFYDLIQKALSQAGSVTTGQIYGQLITISGLAAIAVLISAVTRFATSHYVFRWRTAMNGFYMENWPRLRTVEGASQRVQEDTMRFATTVEGLGVSFVDSVMTLIAFLPVLLRLSANITELPIIGVVPYPLVLIAIGWSIFGTGFLALIGIRLPGLEFRNQRVEAAYRKELVYGEDDPTRAEPRTVAELFADVRRNYFRLYFNYLYFVIGFRTYLQVDNIFPYIILAPTIAAGKITFGLMQQILTAFEQVRSSFQYLVNSWPTIIELLSIYKRLRGFEASIRGEPVDYIEELPATRLV